MANIRIIPAPIFDSQLINGTKDRTSKQLVNRFGVNINSIDTLVGDHIISVFNQTEVVKSLRGNGSVDLQAHFGLTNGLANELVDGMIKIIRNGIHLSSSTSQKQIISIKAISTDWKEYTNLPGAKYISQPSNITIPVIEWMLIDSNIDIGQAAYNIVFEGEKQFDSKVSRSGRAIMVTINRLGGGGGYVLPDIVRHTGGSNFIEFAIGQPDVAQKVAEIVIGKIG
jgi:hypothetical protein